MGEIEKLELPSYHASARVSLAFIFGARRKGEGGIPLYSHRRIRVHGLSAEFVEFAETRSRSPTPTPKQKWSDHGYFNLDSSGNFFYKINYLPVVTIVQTTTMHSSEVGERPSMGER